PILFPYTTLFRSFRAAFRADLPGGVAHLFGCASGRKSKIFGNAKRARQSRDCSRVYSAQSTTARDRCGGGALAHRQNRTYADADGFCTRDAETRSGRGERERG